MSAKACIKRSFLGGCERVSFAEFALRVIQDDQAAQKIARRMLEGHDPYEYNLEEPEFYERFGICDREALRVQIA